MTEIKHHSIETNGIRMHVAEAGDGFPVLLCHGFPELWYSWRHQIPVQQFVQRCPVDRFRPGALWVAELRLVRLEREPGRSAEDDQVAVRVLRDQADSVSDSKSLGIGQGDLLMPVVCVDAECRGDRRLLDENRIAAAALKTDFRLQEDGVPQAVGPRQKVDRAAALPRDVIDRGLNDAIRFADNIRLLGTNRDLHELFPIRLDEVSGDRPRVAVLGKILLQELPSLRLRGMERFHGRFSV